MVFGPRMPNAYAICQVSFANTWEKAYAREAFRRPAILAWFIKCAYKFTTFEVLDEDYRRHR